MGAPCLSFSPCASREQEDDQPALSPLQHPSNEFIQETKIVLVPLQAKRLRL